MKAMAFVPIFTPMVAPVAYASGIMTLFEAIMKCGGPRDTAYLKKILYYKGGIDTYPQMVDLSNIKWSQPTDPIYLQPGDVIYVPKSALVDILRVTGFIGSMITFSSNALDVYNVMTQSNIQLLSDNQDENSVDIRQKNPYGNKQ